MAPLHPFLRKSLFTTKIPMSNITFFYYCGVAYTMMEVAGAPPCLQCCPCQSLLLGALNACKNMSHAFR
jgi:hypothetical protein